MTALSDRDRRVLDFEGRFWHHQASKDEAARVEFGWTSIRHVQIVNALIRRPEALAYAPTTVRRLQRIRARRRTRV